MQHRIEVEFEQSDSRHGSHENTNDQRQNQNKEHHNDVDVNFVRPWQPVKPDCCQSLQRQKPNSQAATAPYSCQQYTLYDELPRDLCTASPKSQSGCQLLGADTRTGKRKVCEVYNSNQQHKDRSSKEQVQGQPDSADEAILKALDPAIKPCVNQKLPEVWKTFEVGGI